MSLSESGSGSFSQSFFFLALHGVFWIISLIINRHAFAKFL